MKEGFTTRNTQKFSHKKLMISKINLTQRNAKEEHQLFTTRTFTRHAKKLIEDKND
jgi:hypothetical protein